MILARLTRAVREQNWLAIAIEFVIVIAGVVIGFQIAGAGERQASRAYERDLMHRLHQEIVNIEEGRDYQYEWLAARRDRMVAIRPVLFGLETREALSERECLALMDSHDFAPPPDSLPALDELVASGRMEEIRNEEIRAAGSDFLQKREVARQLLPVRLNGINVLPDDFPGLFHITLQSDPNETDGDGWDRASHCDLTGMQASQPFQRMAVQNIEHYRNMIAFDYDHVGESLARLHRAGDAELGIEHTTQPAAGSEDRS